MSILLNPVFLLIVGTLVLLVVAIYCTRNKESMQRELQLGNLERGIRDYRMQEMREAYRLARQELGEEPTVDQIFLTRDTLRKDDDGET